MFNSTKSKEFIEKAPGVLIVLLFMCCAWIVIVNALVFVCLVQSKRALKQFVNMQLLSLSVTDMLVGCSAIMTTLTYYKPAVFAHFGICVGIMYVYQTAQAATLFHAFGICIHRLITVKFHSSGSEIFKTSKTKRMLFQLLIVWIVSIGLVAAPFSRYAEFSTSIKVCSLNTLFGSNYKSFVGVLSAILFAPLIGMNLVYVYMLRFLLVKWGRINNNRTTPTRQSINDKQETEIQSHDCEKNEQIRDVSVPAKTTEKLNETSASVSLKEISSNNESYSSSHNLNDSNICDNRKDKNFLNVKCTLSVPTTAHSSRSSDSIILAHPEEHQLSNTDCTVSTNNDTSVHLSTGSKLTFRRQSLPKATASQSHRHFIRNSVKGNKMQKQVLVTIGIILLVLDIFMVPLTLTMFVELLNDGLLSRRVKFILMSLALMNNAINPVVNALRIKPFKDVLRNNWRQLLSKVRS